MALLAIVFEFTMYKSPKSENIIVDALNKLAKELSCLNKEPISLKLHNRHLLAPINKELIEIKALAEEIITLDEI